MRVTTLVNELPVVAGRTATDLLHGLRERWRANRIRRHYRKKLARMRKRRRRVVLDW